MTLGTTGMQYRDDQDQTEPPPTRSPSYAIAWLAEHAVPVAFGAYLVCVFVLVCSPWEGWVTVGAFLHGCMSVASFLRYSGSSTPPTKAQSAILAVSWLALALIVIILTVRFAWLGTP